MKSTIIRPLAYVMCMSLSIATAAPRQFTEVEIRRACAEKFRLEEMVNSKITKIDQIQSFDQTKYRNPKTGQQVDAIPVKVRLVFSAHAPTERKLLIFKDAFGDMSCRSGG